MSRCTGLDRNGMYFFIRYPEIQYQTPRDENRTGRQFPKANGNFSSQIPYMKSPGGYHGCR